MKDIKQGKTLKGIYIDPLFKMLERANTKSERLTNWESEDWKGIFELVPKQELMLMIDVVSSLFPYSLNPSPSLFLSSTIARNINLMNHMIRFFPGPFALYLAEK